MSIFFSFEIIFSVILFYSWTFVYRRTKMSWTSIQKVPKMVFSYVSIMV